MYLPYFLAWGTLLMSMCFAMLCINSLMRGAWCEKERLTFPLIQLPVAMSEGGGNKGMWKSKAMWIAFAIMFSIDILNGLNYLYPNLPSIPVKDLFYIDRAFKDPPWSNIGDFRIAIYPFMAAIGLFRPCRAICSLASVAFFLLRERRPTSFWPAREFRSRRSLARRSHLDLRISTNRHGARSSPCFWGRCGFRATT